MLLLGLRTMPSCMDKLVQQDNSHRHNSNNHSSSKVLMGRQQALHLQHSLNLVSTLCKYILPENSQIVLHVLTLEICTQPA